MKQNRQLRLLGIAIVALIAIFVVMTATARERTQVTPVEKLIATVLYPLQVGTNWVAGKFRGVGQAISEMSHLREENAQLREEIKTTSEVKALNDELAQENNRLRAELAMKERSQYPLLTAQVISRTSDNWYRTVVINQGSTNGVRKDMAVVNAQGLVGKVSTTTPYTATVQLVIDAGFGQGGFGAGAKVASTGELGFISTEQGGHVRMQFFSSDPSVQVGNPIVTSGLGLLPPDLLIGWVESYGNPESALEKYANIRPAVDFNKLDVVHVVLAPTDKDRGANAP